jgi:hypothetical protein
MLSHCSSTIYSSKCQFSIVYPSFCSGAEISFDQLVMDFMPSSRSTPSCTIFAFTLGSLRLVNAAWPENYWTSPLVEAKGYSQGNHCLQGIQRYIGKKFLERGHCS